MTLKRSKFICLSIHIMFQQWLKLYWRNPKKHIHICGNTETLVALEKQLALYMFACLSYSLQSEKYPSTLI